MKTAIIIATVMLSGCMTKPPMWDRPGATTAWFQNDYRACAFEATKAQQQHTNVFIGNDAGTAVGIACMRSKGWIEQ